MKRIYLIVTALIFTSTLQLSAQSSVEQGQATFTQRCAACHAIGKQVVGPDLAGVDQLRSEEWIINFVHSSQKMIQAGDTAATALFAEFNNTVMPDHPDLSDEDIKNIIAYIGEASKALASKSSEPVHQLRKRPYPNAKGDFIHRAIFLDPPGYHLPPKPNDYIIWIMIGTVIVFLTVALVALVRVKDMKEREKEEKALQQNLDSTE